MSTPYDVLLVDLDGTVYRGQEAVPGVVEALEAARGRGVTISYVTNNASRSPGTVQEHLTDLGLTLVEDDVVTSAQAAAALLAQRCSPGDPVLVLGTEALADEVGTVGLRPVRAAADEPVAVVQGHSPQTGWEQLAEATMALGAGASWIACNVDPTLPSDRGLLPGNGSMVAALRMATGREPDVAGKPAAPLLHQAIERAAAQHPLVVGDRLDTDIAGASAVGADSLLVLSGVSTAAEVLTAPSGHRPTFLAADLTAIGAADGALDAVRVDAAGTGWTASVDDGVVTLSRDGDADESRSDPDDPDDPDALAALRALCAAVWAHQDGADRSADGHGVRVRAHGTSAERVVDTLDLPRA